MRQGAEVAPKETKQIKAKPEICTAIHTKVKSVYMMLNVC